MLFAIPEQLEPTDLWLCSFFPRLRWESTFVRGDAMEDASGGSVDLELSSDMLCTSNRPFSSSVWHLECPRGMCFSSPQRSKSPAATNLVAGGLSLRSPPSPHGRNRSRVMPGEVLQRGAPRGHHSPLPTSLPPATPLTRSRLSVPPTTPWQVLRANPCTYEGPPGGYRYLVIELRSEPPRGQRGDQRVRSEAARAVRNEGHRAVRRRPVGPCRLVFHHKYACLACSHSCAMIMVDVPSSFQRISNRYERRGSISVKRVT